VRVRLVSQRGEKTEGEGGAPDQARIRAGLLALLGHQAERGEEEKSGALGWAEAEGREGPGLGAKDGEGEGFFFLFFFLLFVSFLFPFFFLFQSLFKAVSKQFKNILTLLKITQ